MRALAFVLGLGLGLAGPLAGCIIPPSLSVDVQDAGFDSPPSIIAIRSSSQDFPVEPGPVTFASAPNSQNEAINLTLLDPDLDDNLYARIYVNYQFDQPTNARSECFPALSNGSPIRTTSCSAAAICLQSDVGNANIMQIVVFDREVLPVGTPTFKAIPPDGQSTTRTYQLVCAQ